MMQRGFVGWLLTRTRAMCSTDVFVTLQLQLYVYAAVPMALMLWFSVDMMRVMTCVLLWLQEVYERGQLARTNFLYDKAVFMARMQVRAVLLLFKSVMIRGTSQSSVHTFVHAIPRERELRPILAQ
jgi:hypothetical protein